MEQENGHGKENGSGASGVPTKRKSVTPKKGDENAEANTGDFTQRVPANGDGGDQENPGNGNGGGRGLRNAAAGKSEEDCKRNEEGENGSVVDEEGVSESVDDESEEVSEHPDPEVNPMYYDIYPLNFKHIYHVEVGRNITRGLTKVDLEALVRRVIETNFDLIPNFDGRELKDVFPELVDFVTTLKIFKENNIQSRFAEYLDNDTPPGHPSGGTSVSSSSRPRLNSDSKSRGLRRSSSPKRAVSKVTKKDTNPGIVNNGDAKGPKNRCIRFHIFDVYVEDGTVNQLMQDQMDYEDEHTDPTVHSNHFILPHEDWLGLWESLLFEDGIKETLFQYISSALLFSVKEVDTNFVAFNKVVMLHGPPGCGKTSLCKALAQKCSVRFAHRYEGVQFLEVNSHSLFSKWFSESGKLVNKMFDKIFELVHDKFLVFLLIDEVESLAQCRQAAMHGMEPTDSIRAVNAILVNIDQLRKYPNVIILATSNIVGGLDLAFLDRADLKLYLGPPPTEVVYGVLASSLNELLNTGIIAAVAGGFTFPTTMSDERVKNTTGPDSSRILKLTKISKMAAGFSGRALRKMCFLTHARYFHTLGIDLDTFLHALRVTITAEIAENERVNKQRIPSAVASRLGGGTPQRL